MDKFGICVSSPDVISLTFEKRNKEQIHVAFSLFFFVDVWFNWGGFEAGWYCVNRCYLTL